MNEFIDECRNLAFNIRTCWITKQYLDSKKIDVIKLANDLNELVVLVEQLPEKYKIVK